MPDATWGDAYCTRGCSAGDPGSCAYEHECIDPGGAGACVATHMGLACDAADPTGNDCAYACIGVSGGGAHCTRPCSSAADCPGGFACGFVDPGTPAAGKVCMQVNIPCPVGDECPSGIGLCGGAGSWCSAPCGTVSDCPRLLDGIPPYECSLDTGLGYTVCQIPEAMLDFIGELGLGTPCTRGQDCRSGLCATDPRGDGPYCIELCTLAGGCPHGFGCAPVRTGAGEVDRTLFCIRAGTGAMGDPCAWESDCRTGVCRDGRCTRICNDGYCPSAMTCAAGGITAGGVALSFCR
jgi:hypothetical protein